MYFYFFIYMYFLCVCFLLFLFFCNLKFVWNPGRIYSSFWWFWRHVCVFSFILTDTRTSFVSFIYDVLLIKALNSFWAYNAWIFLFSFDFYLDVICKYTFSENIYLMYENFNTFLEEQLRQCDLKNSVHRPQCIDNLSCAPVH